MTQHNRRLRHVRNLSVGIFSLCLFAKAAPIFSAPNPIVMWHTQDKIQSAILKTLLSRFTENTGIAVKLETGMEIEAALLTQLDSGKPPDVVFAPSNLVSLYKDFRLSEISSRWLKNISNEAIHTVAVDGLKFGIPIIQGNQLILLQRKKEAQKLTASWESIIQNKKLKIAVNLSDAYVFLSFYFSHGGNLDHPITISTAACLKTLIFFRSLSESGIAPQPCNYSCITEDFYKGKFDIAVNGDWALEDAKKAFGNSFHWQPLPEFTQGPTLTPAASHALLFPGNSLNKKKRSELKRLIQYLLTDQVQKQWWQNGQRLPVTKTLLRQASTEPRIKALLSTSVGVPTHKSMIGFWNAVNKGLKLFWTNELKGAKSSCQLMGSLMVPR